jgi:hypothetical protein
MCIAEGAALVGLDKGLHIDCDCARDVGFERVVASGPSVTLLVQIADDPWHAEFKMSAVRPAGRSNECPGEAWGPSADHCFGVGAAQWCSPGGTGQPDRCASKNNAKS